MHAYEIQPFALLKFDWAVRRQTRLPNASSRFKFQKRSQLFIRSHNETLSVATMCVNNPDCSAARIHG
jgi:hypothetical protein